ncbi:MAG TPA: hypothetical protein VFK41_11775 [Nocardioidaceae bacterium]|nr:hypothetical protein [Nocardioidaceae bacterium]
MRRHTSTAQPVQIVRQAADAARSAAQNVDVAEVRDTLAAQAARAAEAAQSAAQSVDLASVRDNVMSEMATANEKVITETRRRPGRALLIALGIGTAVGVVLDRMSKRKKAEEAKRQASKA